MGHMLSKDKSIIPNKRVLILKLSAINGLNSSVLRSLALTKGLQELGYTVDWMTIHASSTQILNNEVYDFLADVDIFYADYNKTYESIIANNTGMKEKLVDFLRVIYRKLAIYDHTKNIANNIDISKLNHREYDIVISVSDPKTSHIAIKRLIKQGLKYNDWIQYWGDPMANDITKQSIYPRFLYKAIESKMLKNCDRIVYTSPVTLKEQKLLFKNHSNKMICVPTAYIDKKFINTQDNIYTIGYYGAYASRIRNIMPFYNSCKQLDAKCLIVGDSDLTLESTLNVTVLPRGNINEFEAVTDLFVCILNSKGGQIPGKVYHDAAYNKPILVILDGEKKEEIKDYLSQYNRYYFCNNDEQDIIKCINEIMIDNKVFWPCDSFSPSEVARKIIGC